MLVQAQAQAARGVELMLGAVRDPLFGLGGIWVEALGDVALRLAPISADEAGRALDELRGRSLLDGLRGAPGADRRAFAALAARLSNCIARVQSPGVRVVVIDGVMAPAEPPR